MAGTVNSATQTSDYESDSDSDQDQEQETYSAEQMANSSPRVVIDTSPPFRSVEEAVIRFGGRGFWNPHLILGLDHHAPEESDIYKLEERASTMLKDLHMKEQETLEILKEVELTKRLVEELKLKLPKPCPDQFMSTPRLGFDGEMKVPVNSANNHPIVMELKQAKFNLYQSTNDLAAIRASIESLSKKMEQEKDFVEKAREIQTMGMSNNNVDDLTRSIKPLVISRELRELNYEAEQFMKTAEAARSEVFKAMSEIEQTKTGLKITEMRWVAAKKLEEAAMAAESLALAEIRALSSNNEIKTSDCYQQKPGRISLSLEQYTALIEKARKAEKLLKKEKPSKMALEEVLGMNRNPSRSCHREEKFENQVVRPTTTSIGDILSRKLVVRDDLEVRRNNGEGRGESERVSLSQMLHRQRGETSPPRKREKEGVSKRKGLRFVHISLPLSKHSKNNKIQALNLW